MQAGRANTRLWVLEFASTERHVEPLMGWTASSDTRPQLNLRFATKEEAIAYATRHGIDFQVIEPKTPRPLLKAYADNFKADRADQWTH